MPSNAALTRLDRRSVQTLVFCGCHRMKTQHVVKQNCFLLRHNTEVSDHECSTRRLFFSHPCSRESCAIMQRRGKDKLSEAIRERALDQQLPACLWSQALSSLLWPESPEVAISTIPRILVALVCSLDSVVVRAWMQRCGRVCSHSLPLVSSRLAFKYSINWNQGPWRPFN